MVWCYISVKILTTGDISFSECTPTMTLTITLRMSDDVTWSWVYKPLLRPPICYEELWWRVWLRD